MNVYVQIYNICLCTTEDIYVGQIWNAILIICECIVLSIKVETDRSGYTHSINVNGYNSNGSSSKY